MIFIEKLENQPCFTHGFPLKEKTIEEMKLEKQKYRELAQAAAKENVK